MKSIIMAVLMSVFSTASFAQNTPAEACLDPYVEAVRQAAVSGNTDALHELYDQTRLVANSGSTAERLDARFVGEACARIQKTISGINVLGKSLDQVEAEEAIAEQDEANQDAVNGAQRLINSGRSTDAVAGLESLQRYLARAESAFAGKGLTACTAPGSLGRWINCLAIQYRP